MTRIELIYQARRALTLSNRDLATLVGSSLRTVQRNHKSGGLRDAAELHTLIRALHPRDPALAARLSAASGFTLAEAGVTLPAPTAPPAPQPVAAPPTAPQPAPPLARREHADSVLCAAAEVLNLSPTAVRPALVAAFARARELGFGLEALAPHLAPRTPRRQGKPAGRA